MNKNMEMSIPIDDEVGQKFCMLVILEFLVAWSWMKKDHETYVFTNKGFDKIAKIGHKLSSESVKRIMNSKPTGRTLLENDTQFFISVVYEKLVAFEWFNLTPDGYFPTEKGVRCMVKLINKLHNKVVLSILTNLTPEDVN